MNIGAASFISFVVGALAAAMIIMQMPRDAINVVLDIAPMTQAGDKLACIPVLKPKVKP